MAIASTKWRIHSNKTCSGWAWDVKKLEFFGDSDKLHPASAFSSGDEGPGYVADEAVFGIGRWGGRKSETDGFFIGVVFDHPQSVVGVEFQHPSDTHLATDVSLQYWSEDSGWQQLRMARVLSTKWRIHSDTSTSGWAWDVKQLEFFRGNMEKLHPAEAFSSGDAGPGYDAGNAVLGNGRWGGRRSETEGLYLGVAFDQPVSVAHVQFQDPSESHLAMDVSLQYWAEESGWQVLRIVKKSERGDPELPAFAQRNSSEAPAADECVTPPSRPLLGQVHDCCVAGRLHPPRGSPFQPDPDFFFAEDCEGLWVCVSKNCGVETLQRACDFVRGYIPAELRALWSQFRSPRWAKDPGPMRLVVLDNRTDEQAGIVPELQDQSGGRNGTSCPFVFSSREDFFEGVGGNWRTPRLTTHEMVHGMDMVIRQLVDPALHDIMEDLYREHRDKFSGEGPAGGRVNTYATANRDEFFAEVVCVCRGMLDNEPGYMRCGMTRKDDVARAAPELLNLIMRFFNV